MRTCFFQASIIALQSFGGITEGTLRVLSSVGHAAFRFRPASLNEFDNVACVLRLGLFAGSSIQPVSNVMQVELQVQQPSGVTPSVVRAASLLGFPSTETQIHTVTVTHSEFASVSVLGELPPWVQFLQTTTSFTAAGDAAVSTAHFKLNSETLPVGKSTTQILLSVGKRLLSVPVMVQKFQFALTGTPNNFEFGSLSARKAIELHNSLPLTMRWDTSLLSDYATDGLVPSLSISGGSLPPGAAVLAQLSFLPTNTTIVGKRNVEIVLRAQGNHAVLFGVANASVTAQAYRSCLAASPEGNLVALDADRPTALTLVDFASVPYACNSTYVLQVEISAHFASSCGLPEQGFSSFQLSQAELTATRVHFDSTAMDASPFSLVQPFGEFGSGNTTFQLESQLQLASNRTCSEPHVSSMHAVLRFSLEQRTPMGVSNASCVQTLFNEGQIRALEVRVVQRKHSSTPLWQSASTPLRVLTSRGSPNADASLVHVMKDGLCATAAASSGRTQVVLAAQQPALLVEGQQATTPGAETWLLNTPCVDFAVTLRDSRRQVLGLEQDNAFVAVNTTTACSAQIISALDHTAQFQRMRIIPVRPGLCAVSIFVDGQHVRGSPLSLRVLPAACDGAGELPSPEGQSCTCQPGYKNAAMSNPHNSDALGSPLVCKPCTSGFFSAGGTAATCLPCMSGTVSNAARSRCIACPDSIGIECFTGSITIQQGYWCSGCSFGSNGGIQFGSRQLQVGQFTAEPAAVAHRCINMDVCIPSGNMSNCAIGHTGPLCGSCVSGYAFTAGAFCRKCEALTPYSLFLLTVIGSVLILVLPFWLAVGLPRHESASTVQIGSLRMWSRWAQAVALLCASQVLQVRETLISGLIHAIADAAFVFPVTSHGGRCALRHFDVDPLTAIQASLLMQPVTALAVFAVICALYGIWCVVWPATRRCLRVACPTSSLNGELEARLQQSTGAPGSGHAVSFRSTPALSLHWNGLVAGYKRTAALAMLCLSGALAVLSLRVLNVHAQPVVGTSVLETDTSISVDNERFHASVAAAVVALALWVLGAPLFLLARQVRVNPHAYKVSNTRRLQRITFTMMTKEQLALLSRLPNKLLDTFGFVTVGFRRPALSWVHSRVHHRRCCLELQCGSREHGDRRHTSLLTCSGIMHNYKWATWAVQLLCHFLLVCSFGLTSRPLLQVQGAIAVVLLSLTAHMLTMPYESGWMNALEAAQHLAFGLACGLGSFSEAAAEQEHAQVAPDLSQTLALGWILLAPVLMAVIVTLESRVHCLRAVMAHCTAHRAELDGPTKSLAVDIAEHSVSAHTPEPSFFTVQPPPPSAPAVPSSATPEVVSLIESLSAVADREDGGAFSLQILQSFGSDGSGVRVRARHAPAAPTRWPSMGSDGSPSSCSGSTGSLSSLDMPTSQ